MNKLTEKILETIFWCICLIIVILLSSKYFYALFIMDDDAMFIVGLTLVTLTCSFILILIFTAFIANIWHKNKEKNKKKNKN